MIRVQTVHPDSIAAELGIRPGFELETIDGRPLLDFLDWEFLTASEAFLLRAKSDRGEWIEYDIERPEGLPMGVVLEPPHIRRCANRCDFCFVDGLPEGLRDTLYVRDDDYRLSFRYGNFATLTNLKDRDVERILEYRLTPLYVSVHATDPVVRRRLLRNPRAPDVREQIRQLAAGGIQFHTQIVLQPGVNDGPVLEASLTDLYALGDAVLSVSVVPVGLTEFSKRHLVHELSPETCRAAIALVERFQARARQDRGKRWAYGSDDLYLGADLPLPPVESYDGFEQVENGVGSVRYLQTRVQASAAELPSLAGRRIGVLTGVAMARAMPHVLDTLRTVTGATFELMVLSNDLFGPTVTSAGLLPGRAFKKALGTRHDLDLALLPAESVNESGLFLDDMSVEQLRRDSPIPFHLSYDFADALVEDR
jgi:putative radical SAM enzyme (TIGR03279 family)